MSQSNVEIAHQIFAAWGRGDYSQGQWFDADLEWEQGLSQGGTTGARGHGLESLGRFWADVMSAYDALRSEAEEILEIDDDQVLILSRFAGAGRISGLPVHALRGAALFRFRDGRVVQAKLWPNHETALAELGLKR